MTTTTPWHEDYKNDREHGRYWVITDSDGKTILDAFNSEVAIIHEESDGEGGFDRWDEQGKQDARFAVLAVNAYQQMLEALKASRIMLRIMLECWGDTSTNDMGKFRNITGGSTLKEVEAAIAKAEAPHA